MARKIILTEEEKRYINEEYSKPNLSISQIARNLKLDRGVVKRYAKEEGLVKVFPKNTQGIKFKWTDERIEYLIKMYDSDEVTVVDIAENLGTSEDTTTKKAKELGLVKKRKQNYKEEDIQYIKDKVTSLTIKEIANHLDFSHEFIRLKMIELDIHDVYMDTRENEWKLKRDKEKEEKLNRKLRTIRREAPIDNEDFLWDLTNPYYTNYNIGKKWDIHPDTAGNWRKRLIGKIHYSPKDEFSITYIEDKVRDLLLELDLAFFFQHTIGKWSIDFYLGNKKCVEVQGKRFHTREKTIEKDKRKKEELEKLGYSILYLKESVINNDINEVKNQILGFLQQ